MVALVSVIYLWSQRAAKRPTEAWAALSSAMTPEQYRKLLADYPSTEAALEGRLELGRLLIQDPKQHAEARQLFQQVLEDAGSNEYHGARALLGLAELDEQERRTDEALKTYQRLVEQYPAPGFVELAKAREKALRMPNRPLAPAEAFEPLPKVEATTSIPWRPWSRPATRAASGPTTRE